MEYPGPVIVMTAFVGFVLSCYGSYVHWQMDNDPFYVALCDGAWYSCSAVFKTKYGSMLSFLSIVEKKSVYDLPNTYLGIAGYLPFLFYPSLSTTIPHGKTVFWVIAIAMNMFSVGLGYILLFILGDFCPVCVTMYVVNAVLMYFTTVSKNASISTKKHTKTA